MSEIVLSTHDAAGLFGRPAAFDLRHPAPRGASTLMEPIVIHPRHNGPRRSANGGFAAGAIARRVDADVVTVKLRRPVPLGKTLRVIAREGQGCEVLNGRTLIADAAPGRLVETVMPQAPDWHEAEAARNAHPLAGVRHPFSDCVVCAPGRRDGMHVTPGPLPDRPEMLAAPWLVDSRDAVGGTAPFAAVWAAMDCPSYPAAALRERELCLLGTMTASVMRRPRVGEQLVVFSWTRERVGRRIETSVAVVDASGVVAARADSTWIAVRRQRLARAIGRFA
ncbi:hypothetical protein ACFQ0P_13195 [Microbacterium insulae]|uniref:Thioesterase superfamily protein n=1 Tax=Microbacterium insulae TaxID=483014 RepID=A0ABW3AL52_9MICO